MANVIQSIRSDLKKMADQKLKESGQRFFKESVKMYGTKTAAVLSLARHYWPEIMNLPKNEILDLCQQLWQSGFMEESFIACQWTTRLERQFASSDIELFEQWIDRYVTNWAACDTFCNHTVGALIERYPQCLDALRRWTGSPNRWLRRAAAVSLIVPARRGLFLPDILDIADRLLLDKDDLVQKGYGWMLKAASEAHCQAVYDFVITHKSVMPRTALRYAIEKMPAAARRKAMAR